MAESWKEFSQQKIISPELLPKKIREIRQNHLTIATLNGSFDLLHAGHLHILFEAAQAADILFVALNSDLSIQTYKSPFRPIISLPYRLELIAALGFVDYVTWFEETDPRRLLGVIRPDVHVNGAEYGENCIEAEVVKAHGGKIKIVDLLPGLSTTKILHQIAEAQAKESSLPCV